MSLDRVLAAQIRAAVIAEPTELGRAVLLRDLVRTVSDAVKMSLAEGGTADTAERRGVGEVSDAAQHYWSQAADRGHDAQPTPLPAAGRAGDDRLHEMARWRQDPTEVFEEMVLAPQPGR